MQDLDNNMDDLFRKAAENYRPSPGKSQWKEIVADMAKQPQEVVDKQGNKKRNYTGILLICLFLIAGTISKFTNFTKPDQDSHKLPLTNNRLKSSGESSSENRIKQSETKKALQPVNQNIRYLNPVAAINNESNQKNEENSNEFNHTANITEPLLLQKESLKPDLKEHVKSKNLNVITTTEQNLALSHFNNTKISAGNYNAIYNGAKVSEDAHLSILKTKGKSVPVKVEKKIRRNVVYLGLIAGLEFSGVSSLQMDQVGYEFGLIGGYQFNKRISLESGLLLSKKNYPCSGEYFNMDDVSSSMPQGMEIISLNSNCTVYEIPIKVNYHVINKTRSTMYISAGLSSYLLTNETNKYNTLLAGNQKDITSSYNENTGYFAATADFHLGVEKKLHNGNRIRFEPYIQIPLKGIGIGDVKVLSAGIHAGYTLFPKSQQ